MSKVTILTKPNRIVIASKGVQGPPGPQGEGISDAPDDGGAYIRVNGQWVQLYAPLALVGDLPDGTVDEPYSATLTASGGRPPYTLGDVLLPPGLDAMLSDATVTVAGTPSEEWATEAHIDLSDSLGSAIRSVFDVGVGGGGGYNPASEFSGGALGALYPVWDISTLSQDRDGTVPVTADGDPVRHMRDTSGNGNHWAPTTDAGFGTYTIVDGLPCVRIPAAGFFATAKDKTLALPAYIICAIARRTADSNAVFGLGKDSSNRYGVIGQPTLDRVGAYLRTAATGISQAVSASYSAPLFAPAVVSTLAVDGLTDVATDGSTPATATNTWSGTSDTGYAYVLTSNTGTAATSAECDFYGGMILQGAPSDRAALESYFQAKITAPLGPDDFNVLVIGDSTGDERTEWPYGFAQHLAAENPTSEVSYRGWDNDRSRYAPSIQVQAGSAPAFRVFNASVAGSQPVHHMGANFSTAIQNVPYQAVIWNHGNNLVDGTNDAAGISVYGKYSGAMDQVRQALPGVPHMVVRPSPVRTTEAVAPVVAGLDFVVAAYGDILVADVYGAFMALGRPETLYLPDNVHPSAAGTQVFVDTISAAWDIGPLAASGPAFLDTTDTNLLTNGDFATFTDATPAGWAKVGPGAVAKDEARKIDGSPWSVRVSSGASQTDLQQSISAMPYRGQNVTLATKQWLEAGGSTNAGQIYLQVDGASGRVVRNQSEGKGAGGWRWTVVTIDVPADATTITTSLTASVTGTGVSYYDRAILVAGSVPRDMA